MRLGIGVVFVLVDLRTGNTLGEFPDTVFSGRIGASRAAGVQARRLAAGGIAVLLVGGGVQRAYLPEGLEVARADTPSTGSKRRRSRRKSAGQLQLPLDVETVRVTPRTLS